MDTKQDSNSSSSKPTVTDLPPVRQQPDECRLWIGNLDLRITEYAMLKLLQRYDITIRSLDFIYHRAGPEKGQPRGYCFVTLSTPAEAAMILSKLNGKMALSRRLVVKYADLQKRDRPADAAEISLGGTPQPSADVATTSKSARLDVKGKIDAIEEKLKTMDENKDGSTPAIVLFPPPANIKRQQELAAEAAERAHRRKEFQYRRPAHRRRPYQRRGR